MKRVELARARRPPCPARRRCSPRSGCSARDGRARAGARARAARTRRRPSGSGARAGTISRTRRLCSWPMKSHSNSSPWAATFCLQVLRAVLAHQPDPRLGEDSAAPRGHVLGGGEHLAPWRSRPARALAAASSSRDPREVRADRLGAQSGDQLNHATPPWRPARSPSRRWEKKRRRRSCTARRRAPPSRPRRAAARGRSPRGRSARVAVRVRPSARVHLGADLIAAAARAGPDAATISRRPRRARATRAPPARARPRPGPASRRAPSPPPRRSERHRQAVGAQHDRAQPASAVACPSASRSGTAATRAPPASRSLR